MGILAFFIVVGSRVINPSNIAWLAEGDSAVSYLGWLFFRHGSWFFPIGLNPDYGIEISSAIIFSDSIPLFAFPVKLLSSSLGEPFQYFGIFIFISFVLQAMFAWLIVGLITKHTALKAIGAGLFLFAPPMLFRLHGHISLTGHFLVLAGIYLALNPRWSSRTWAWAMLLAVCALVHAYFVAMVGALWVATLIWNPIKREVRLHSVIFEAAIVISVLLGVLWQTGYFTVASGVGEGGFGFYRMNLLSIIDSNGWSYVLEDIDHASGNHEGFNYLGLGIISLLFCAFPVLISRKVTLFALVRRFPVLLVTLVLLTVFALSNKVSVGAHVWEYHLPVWMLKIAGILRASGRMFWPVFYILLLSLIYIVVRGYSTGVAIGMLGLALSFQVIDTSSGWLPLREKLMTEPKSNWATPLTSPFWRQAASKYKKIRGIPLERHPPQLVPVAYYAGKNRLVTDVVFLNRIDRTAWRESQKSAISALNSGNYNADSLYVLGANAVWQAALNMDRSADLLMRVDGLTLLAPGWRDCSDCFFASEELKLEELIPWVRVGQRILFNRGEDSRVYLSSGWSEAETWGTWSDGQAADILLPITDPIHSIIIEADALITSRHPAQRVIVRAEGELLASESFTDRSKNHLAITIPGPMQQVIGEKRYIRIQLEFPDAISPLELGVGTDARELGLGLIAITLH